MGFGLCFTGFLLLTLVPLGLDALGYVLIAVGFFKVSKELVDYKGYKIAGILAAVAAPIALLSLYALLENYTALPALPKVVSQIKVCCLSLVSAALCMAHCQSTARIARQGGAKVFAARASITMYLSALFYTALTAGAVFGAPGAVAAITTVARYAVPLLNAWLLFTCFTTITTKARAREEARIIKKQTEILKRRELKKHGGDTEDK